MKKKEKKQKVSKATLKRAIEKLTREFNELDPASEEATKVAANIKTLSEALDKMPRIKGDTVVAGGVTVLTTAMILNFEKVGCITSKAFGFIPKLRIH